MTPIDQRRPIRHGRIQWVIRASAIILALHGRAVAAQVDTHAHSAKPGDVPRLGTVTFPTSGNARARAAFVRGIALLHSFHYEEAAKAFQAAERADSAFALPYWFEAFTHSHLLWGEEDVTAARQVLARLKPTPEARLAKAATPRERAYGAAFEAFYADTTIEVRTRAFADSMRSLTTRYPDDLEAAAFTSLALMLAIDEDAFPSDTMKVRATQMVERAEHVFKANPNHPGAAHYLIHVSDLDPSFSTSALPAARAYARIAPDASHALHMPSHVFLRLGLWDEVASSNEQSWAASRREMARDKLSGAELDSHSLRFLAYAYLEGGRWRAARALADSARRVIGNADVYGASHVDTRYTISDLTFLNAAETGRWNDAVLPPIAQGPPQNPRERFFATSAEYARVVIQAMRGDTAALAAGAAAFRSRANAAGPAARGLEFMASEIEGLVAQTRGDSARAIERLAHAGAVEDEIPLVGPPTFLSARELLGAAYVKAGRPDSAAAQFERVLAHQPNRSAALLGLARARVAMGDRDAAAKSYSRLAENWRRADADVPALGEVRAGAAGKFNPTSEAHVMIQHPTPPPPKP
jgi:tetratricopeptide (TPR) repeat protein